jgi:hypothetical protein
VQLTLYYLLIRANCHKHGLSATQIGNWIESAAIGSYPRSNAVCFTINNKAYIGTGYNENIYGHRLNDFWEFSTDNGWKQLQDFPGMPRSNAVGFSVDNYGYVGTGLGENNTMYKDFYRYDPALNQWTIRDSFPFPRFDAVGFGLKGKGYIGTGFSNYWLNDFYQYDPQSDTWTKTTGTSGDLSKRRGAVAFVYKDKAYIATGSTSGSMARDFWSFDPDRTAPWKRLANITNTDPAAFDDGYTDIQREFAVGFVKGDSAYLTLGRNISLLSSTWVYDFAKDRWGSRTPYHRQPRFSAVAFTVNGRSFVGTGNTGNSTFDDFDEFLPYQPYNSND